MLPTGRKNANHDGVTQQISDRLRDFETDDLLVLLFAIEYRAKLYYISGGKTSGGDTPTPSGNPTQGGTSGGGTSTEGGSGPGSGTGTITPGGGGSSSGGGRLRRRLDWRRNDPSGRRRR